MCLLVVCEPNATPKLEDLMQGACSNPHGYGFAIAVGDKIISERGMSAKKVTKRFLELREQYPDSYAIYHQRYATHGVKNEGNCHPFKVGGSDMTYLAHNGVLSMALHDKDKRSDSRVFAEDTLPLIGGVASLDDENVFTMVSKFASSSKIAILTVDPKASFRLYLINENLGHWDKEGIWWSNYTYEKPRVYTPHATPYVWNNVGGTYEKPATVLGVALPLTLEEKDEIAQAILDRETPDLCPQCLGLVNLYDDLVCPTCKACLDCQAPAYECLCYTPHMSGRNSYAWGSY